MKLEAIQTHLENLGLGISGRSIFVNEMPSDCKSGVLLLDTYSGTEIDYYKPGYHDTGFRVAVRSPEVSSGVALAMSVLKALTIQSDLAVEAILIRQCLPVNLPRPYRRSVGGYWEWEIDVDLVFCVVS